MPGRKPPKGVIMRESRDEASARIEQAKRKERGEETRRLSKESGIGGKFTMPEDMTPEQYRRYEKKLGTEEDIAEGARGDFNERLNSRILKENPALREAISSQTPWALEERERLANVLHLDELSGTDYFTTEIKAKSQGLETGRWLLGSE